MTQALLYFQADHWRSASVRVPIELAWEHGFYPNDEQWVRLKFPDKKVDRLTILAGFHDREPLDRQVMRLLILLEAARRAAGFIHLFIPYLPYSLQERDVRGGDAAAARALSLSLESLGVDKITIVDIHNPQFMTEWRIPAVSLDSNRLLADRIQSVLSVENLAVVAPDKGAVARASSLGEFLHVPVFLLEKERYGPGEVQVRGDLTACPAKHLLLVDDMVNTGGTLAEASRVVREQCGAKVSVAATHPLFAGKAVEKLRGAGVEEIFVTNSFDSWPLRLEAKIAQLYVADVGLLLAP
jgi:ribose-phosphate pyrophosphokinase